jgi:hypothetical protein
MKTNNENATKECTICHVVKPISTGFSLSNGYRRSVCKTCHDKQKSRKRHAIMRGEEYTPASEQKERECRDCHLVKPLTEYYYQTGQRCKVCVGIANAEKSKKLKFSQTKTLEMEVKNLVKRNEAGQLVTTSKIIAKKFKRQHYDIMPIIRALDCGHEVWDKCFTIKENVITWGDRPRHEKYAEITQKGFGLLSNKITVGGVSHDTSEKVREEFIVAFAEESTENTVEVTDLPEMRFDMFEMPEPEISVEPEITVEPEIEVELFHVAELYRFDPIITFNNAPLMRGIKDFYTQAIEKHIINRELVIDISIWVCDPLMRILYAKVLERFFIKVDKFHYLLFDKMVTLEWFIIICKEEIAKLNVLIEQAKRREAERLWEIAEAKRKEEEEAERLRLIAEVEAKRKEEEEKAEIKRLEKERAEEEARELKKIKDQLEEADKIQEAQEIQKAKEQLEKIVREKAREEASKVSPTEQIKAIWNRNGLTSMEVGASPLLNKKVVEKPVEQEQEYMELQNSVWEEILQKIKNYENDDFPDYTKEDIVKIWCDLDATEGARGTTMIGAAKRLFIEVVKQMINKPLFYGCLDEMAQTIEELRIRAYNHNLETRIDDPTYILKVRQWLFENIKEFLLIPKENAITKANIEARVKYQQLDPVVPVTEIKTEGKPIFDDSHIVGLLEAIFKAQSENNATQLALVALVAELRDVKKHESGELNKIYRQLINVENSINRNNNG